MNGRVTSFAGLFSGADAVGRVTIPLIQRDYAQGRQDPNATRIRGAFLDVLHGALVDAGEVGLDFVFGDLRDGAFTPLDGQQRLTTLFLLHWYLDARAAAGGPDGWKRFTYETRATARAFCEELVTRRPPSPVDGVSAWIEDQPWFLSTWRHDPTVDAMLVMLDAIHTRFRDADCPAAWRRLTDSERPAVTFHLLPVEGMGRPDEVYLKMNSRGKPLTPFETFKALFEKTVAATDPARGVEFADKVDGAWADLLWPQRGDDDLIDDEFMRCMLFATELCEWEEGRRGKGDLLARAEATFGAANPQAHKNLARLFEVFDVWRGVDARAFFEAHLTLDRHEPGKVAVYRGSGDERVDLFAACCRSYGEVRGQGRVFSLERTLLLLAAITHRAGGTQDFPRRLRVLRNLLEASEGMVRSDVMATLVPSVRRFVADGDLDGLKGFSPRQVDEERRKAALLDAHPELAPAVFALEDHPLLRGCLAAFPLDTAPLAARAAAFHAAFSDGSLRGALTGALLACGDYARPLPRFAHRFQFGTASPGRDEVWRRLLTGSELHGLDRTRAALTTLLDRFAATEGTAAERLASIQRAWLAERESAMTLDWRYYLVKYPAMREGESGLYVGLNGALGYSLCMLRKQQLNSYYRDPYLLAIVRRSGAPGEAVVDPWFMGYEHQLRWLQLARSGVRLRCAEAAFELRPPTQAGHADGFARVCAAHGVGADGALKVPQVARDGRGVDTRDRVELAAALLRDLVAAGC